MTAGRRRRRGGLRMARGADSAAAGGGTIGGGTIGGGDASSKCCASGPHQAGEGSTERPASGSREPLGEGGALPELPGTSVKGGRHDSGRSERVPPRRGTHRHALRDGARGARGGHDVGADLLSPDPPGARREQASRTPAAGHQLHQLHQLMQHAPLSASSFIFRILCSRRAGGGRGCVN